MWYLLSLMAHSIDEGPASRVEWEQWRRERVDRIRPFDEQRAECERAIIVEAINLCLGNREEAMERLGLPRTTFYRKLRAE